MKVKLLSRVRLFVTPWTAAHQAPPSMGFSRQEYWSGVPLPSPSYAIPLHKNIYHLYWFLKTNSSIFSMEFKLPYCWIKMQNQSCVERIVSKISLRSLCWLKCNWGKNKWEILENNVDKLPNNVQSFKGNEILGGLEMRAVEMKNGRKHRKNQIPLLNILCLAPY